MSFMKNRTQPQSTSFLFLRAEDEATNVKELAIEEDFGTMPFNKKQEPRGLGAEKGEARRINSKNKHTTNNGTSSLSKKLSSSKQPSPSSMNNLPPDSSKSSLVPVDSRNSTDVVDQTTSASLAVAFQQHQQSIELTRQAHREFFS